MVSAAFAYLLAGALLLIALPVFLGAHVWLWGVEGIDFSWQHALALLPLTVAHEGLHGVGFLLAGAPRSQLRFGFSLKRLTPFAHCSAPMRARGYRVSVVLPGVALGLVPAILGVATGFGWLTVIGAVMIGAAGGDLAVLWAIRRVPRDVSVRDHPSKPGCLSERTRVAAATEATAD